MKTLHFFIVFACVTLSSSAGFAQTLDDTPLARCPGYEKNNPLISEIGWSVNCLLTALHGADKEIVAALSSSSRCDREPEDCDGPLDRYTSQGLFGIGNSGKRETGDAAATWLKKAKTFLITFYNQPEGRVEVRIIPRPGKRTVKLRDGFYKDFYATDFAFDPDRAVWVVRGMIFFFETDNYVMGSEDAPIDLTGRDSVLPPMVWSRPASR